MADFYSKRTGEQIEALLDIVSQGGGGGGEGGTITEAEITAMGFTKNLGTITEVKMNGVSKGTDGVVDLGTVITQHQDISGKVDKVTGKGLSTEDFTTALKTKLEGLSNYNDAEISNAVSSLQTQLNTLVSGNANDAINSFNEIIAFLDGIKDTQDLASIIASIEQQIASKMDAVTLATVATSGSYNDLSNKPTIPSAVTESTVSGWGFTKNTGTYSKPSTGIPKTDLASAVQTSLGKADTALQSVPNTYATNEYVDNKLATTLAFYRTRFTFQELVEAKNIGESILEGGKTELVQAITLGKTIVMDYDSMSGVEGHILVNATLEGDEILLQIVFGNEHIVVSTFNDGDTIYPDDITYDFFVAESDFNNTIGGLNANKQDTLVSGTNIKTINGQSLLGSGNITIEGGGGGSGSGGSAYAQVNHGTSDTIFTLTPNTFHVWDEVASLTLTLGSETSGIANEFLFQFTSGSTATSLTLPEDIKWANDTAPTIAENMIYQISILKGLASCLEFSNKGLFPATIVVGQDGYAELYSYFMNNYSLPNSSKPSGAIECTEQITVEDTNGIVDGNVIKVSLGLTDRVFFFTEKSIDNYYAVYINKQGMCDTYMYD